MLYEEKLALSREKRILKMEFQEGLINSRVCPTCEIKFMAAHLGTKYCSDLCADKFHNRNKLKKLKESNHYTNLEFLEQYKINEALLVCFIYIDNKHETTFDELIGLNFQFGVYDEIYDGKNSSTHKEIKIGDYTVERLEKDKVLITKIS